MSWWIEYITPGGGSGELATPKYVQAASPPAASGGSGPVEWVYGPYPSRAAAVADAVPGPPDSSKLVSSRHDQPPKILKPVATAVADINSGQGLARALTEPNTWIRVAEVVLGGALLLIAIAHLASNTPAGRAARALATKAAIL